MTSRQLLRSLTAPHTQAFRGAAVSKAKTDRQIIFKMRARGASYEEILEVLYWHQSLVARAWSRVYWSVALAATKLTGRVYPKWLRKGLKEAQSPAEEG